MFRFATLNRVVLVAESTLGARLLRARLEYGSRLEPPRVITQMEIAQAMGVSGVAVGGWEADRNEPGLEKLRGLARLYGVRVGWLVDGELPMRAEGGEGEGGTGVRLPDTGGPVTTEPKLPRATEVKPNRTILPPLGNPKKKGKPGRSAMAS